MTARGDDAASMGRGGAWCGSGFETRESWHRDVVFRSIVRDGSCKESLRER